MTKSEFLRELWEEQGIEIEQKYIRDNHEYKSFYEALNRLRAKGLNFDDMDALESGMLVYFYGLIEWLGTLPQVKIVID